MSISDLIELSEKKDDEEIPKIPVKVLKPEVVKVKGNEAKGTVEKKQLKLFLTE